MDQSAIIIPSTQPYSHTCSRIDWHDFLYLHQGIDRHLTVPIGVYTILSYDYSYTVTVSRADGQDHLLICFLSSEHSPHFGLVLTILSLSLLSHLLSGDSSRSDVSRSSPTRSDHRICSWFDTRWHSDHKCSTRKQYEWRTTNSFAAYY